MSIYPATGFDGGLQYTYTIGSSIASVSSYDNIVTDVTILADFVVDGNTYIVTSIGYLAFYNKTNLTKVTIPATVTSIGENAFYLCGSLTSVTFAGTSQLQTIRTSVFQSSGLTTIIIPESVTTIGRFAFYLCGSLTSVTFAGTSQLQTIGTSAFESSGLTYISIPESVTSIGRFAFYACASLTSVTFAGTSQLQTIGNSAFQSSGLTYISIPASVTSIGTSAFYGCASLETIVWVNPTALTVLGTGAFNTGIAASGSVTYYQTYYNSPADTNLPAVLNPPAGPGSIYLSKYAIAYINASGTPDAPTNVEAVSTGSTTATVSFDRPNTPVGSTVNSCTVTSIPAGVSQTFAPPPPGARVSVTVTGLGGGTQYTFTVVANNRVGPSESSNPPSNPITTNRANGITSGTAAAGQTTIPVDNAQAQGFRIGNNIRIENGPTEETRVIGGFGSIVTTANLTNTYPTGSTLSQITAPGAPTNLAATAGNTEVSISFTVDDGGSPITNMSYSLNGAAFANFVPAQTTSPVTITGLNNDQTYSIRLIANNAVGPGPASAPVEATPVLCFNKGTEILCLNEETGEEEYVLIEHLKKGDLVKSFNHGYRKIDIILHKDMINTPSKWHACMFKMKKTERNGLTEDLIVTGGHSILVDDLGELKEINAQMFYGNTPKIDGKYLLLSCVSPDFVQLENHYIYTWYHFTLENDGDDDRRFGVWANGILSETPSKNQLVQMRAI